MNDLRKLLSYFRPYRVSLFIGIATFPAHATSRADLFRAADDALYAAKRSGRNRVCVADRSVDTLDDALSRVSRKNDAAQQASDDVVM